MSNKNLMTIVSLAVAAGALAAATPARAGECKAIHATMVETRSTVGCAAPATACFFGAVDGNHGLRGTTYFSSDSARVGPATSPSFFSYSGIFNYYLMGGTLTMRETGISFTGPGPVTAYQEITGGTGGFAGATGYLFVSGFKIGDGTTVSTEINGQICLP